jgi:hypothetical protein
LLIPSLLVLFDLQFPFSVLVLGPMGRAKEVTNVKTWIKINLVFSIWNLSREAQIQPSIVGGTLFKVQIIPFTTLRICTLGVAYQSLSRRLLGSAFELGKMLPGFNPLSRGGIPLGI